MSNTVQLHLKFIKGPASGSLFSCSATRTTDVDMLIDQLQQALARSDVKITRNELAFLARRHDGAKSHYVDGLLATKKIDCAAYFIIAEENLVTPAVVEAIVQMGINQKLILQALKYGHAMLRVLTQELPPFRESPDPYTELWSPETGLSRPKPLSALPSGAD
jgi:hypothetical protein